MNWEAVGASGELLGAAAVLITLAYLAAQVRHARQDIRRSARHSRVQAARERLLTRATHPELNRLIVRAQQGLGMVDPPGGFVATLQARIGLQREEAAALHYELAAEWQYRTEAILNADQMSAGERFEFEHSLRFNYGRANPLGVLWLESNRERLNPEVLDYVDRVVAAGAQPNHPD